MSRVLEKVLVVLLSHPLTVARCPPKGNTGATAYGFYVQDITRATKCDRPMCLHTKIGGLADRTPRNELKMQGMPSRSQDHAQRPRTM